MPNENIAVSSYGAFQDGVSTINNLNSDLETSQKEIANCKSSLDSDAVFMGPICDSCMDAFSKADSITSDVVATFSSIASYLTDTAASYKEGDTAGSQLLLSIDPNTNRVVTSTKATAAPYANKGNISGDNLNFINSIKDGAVQAYNEYGVLPSLTMAQAILESGWGKHSIGNNIFGIKAGSSWTGKTQNCLTSEQNADGSYYQITDTFRDYDSIDESITDHAKLLTNDRYKPVLEAKNYKEACVAVRQCGYATSLDYANSLISLVEQYGLDQWDPV